MSTPSHPDEPEVEGLSVNLRYLLTYLKPYAGLVTWTLVTLIAARVAAALDPVWLKKIIDEISQGKATIQTIIPLAAVYFGFKVATAFFEYLRDIIFAPAEMGIAKTLSERLFEHLLILPAQFHVEQKIGALSRKITRGGRAIGFILDFLVINILPTVVGLIFTTALLLKLYPPVYAVITFGTVVAYTWFTIWSTEKRQKFRLGANLADDDVAGIEVDALTNIDTIKFFNNEQQLMRRYRPSVQKRFELSVSSNKLFALISAVQQLILLVGLGALLVLAIRQVIAGTMSVGDLVLLTTYIVQLSAPIGILGFIYRQIKDGLADLNGMAEILQHDITIKEPSRPTPIEKPKGKVQFNNVHFGYKGRNQVINGLDLDIKPGERVAFVGSSGAGKSTIVKLLFRMYDPTKGEITVDGVDLRKLSKETRRSIFTIVPQEPVLFNTTIRENISFGKEDATQEEIETAAKAASIDSVIKSFPEGYDTIVGERGVKLSGGEKQRVAIARAIIRQPKVIVFDEATSSLDTKSEREIQEALDRVSEGRTTIAVAHRLSTIVNSDRIYVLGDGAVLEKGTHTELLSKKGVYAKLWNMQAHHKQEVKPEEEIPSI